MRVVELAPAKLNLTLDVGKKHPDGYHDVISVMTGAALCDVITVESGAGEGITLTCSDPALACDEANLAYRAAQLFFSHFGIECDGVHIHLEKHIPMQAGLGGGSSDAAAVLRALRQIYAPNMTLRELERISIRLGSDVPYCICGGTTLVLGRGEQLIKKASMPACWLVLCKPEESYSTAAMYRRIDDEQPQCTIDTEAMLQALKEKDLHAVAQRIGNIFEYVLPENSAVPSIRRRLCELGAVRACMSGSGSAVFGLFAEEETAVSACEAMKEEFPHTWLAKSV
ncbi:MAG: 4-(cytidine 5'-diphospho)-2-C-methyl-D-erythritol kinase [Ruminococcaceae bacterium]|nr:4-(cytidine 5'-diphospho)-2-C-methyl-D-erythritol kinase [Oscillospiraceae bacterium]